MGFREKAIIIGYDIQELKSKEYNTTSEDNYRDAVSYLASKDNEHILYIPDNVCEISEYEKLRDIRGNLRVQGGKRLNHARNLFSRVNLNILDLRTMSAENLTITNWMFMQSKIKELYFCKAEHIYFMDSMFENLECEHLDITGLTVKNVRSMERAFMYAKIGNKELNLNYWAETLNNSKVLNNIESLFESGEFTTIDIHELRLSKINNNKNLFRFCKIKREAILSDDDYREFKGEWSNRYNSTKIVTYKSSRKYWFGDEEPQGRS